MEQWYESRQDLGKFLQLGNYATLGDSVTLGNYVKLGDPDRRT
jgi:hypothetical protein